MNPRICICCGEPMSERGQTLSRNPNMCACCSSLEDGMDTPSLSHLPERATVESRVRRSPHPDAPNKIGATAPQAALAPF